MASNEAGTDEEKKGLMKEKEKEVPAKKTDDKKDGTR